MSGGQARQRGVRGHLGPDAVSVLPLSTAGLFFIPDLLSPIPSLRMIMGDTQGPDGDPSPETCCLHLL